jgi:hypothetical protein
MWMLARALERKYVKKRGVGLVLERIAPAVRQSVPEVLCGRFRSELQIRAKG